MRIAVVGLGGVGGYIAASLAKTAHDLVGFARGDHLDTIKKQGLKIVEDTLTWHPKSTSSHLLTAHVEIDARTLDEADGYFDLVLFCVKSYDLEESYKAISRHTDSKTILLCFSNGVSHGDELRELTQSRVLDGCVYILSHIEEPGIIRKKGKVFSAVFGGLEEEAQLLKNIFDEAGLRLKTPSDIQTAIWKKYIFISAFATLTSYHDKSIGYVYENHLNEAKEALNEVAALAHAKGLDIFDEVQKALDIAKGLPYDASTSMHLDFVNKKRDELETLSGYIVKEAKKLDVKVPLMQKMYEKLLRHSRA